MRTTTLETLMTTAVLVAATACGSDRNDPMETAGLSDGATDGGDSGAMDTDGGEGTGGPDSGDPDSGGDTDGEPVADCSQLSFDNSLDEAMCPYIQGEGVEPPPADEVELCRRAFIDLKGVSPTAVDYEVSCKDKTPEELVDDLMAADDYVRMAQRAWSDTFQYNSEITFYEYIADLDVLVGQLYRNELTVDEFVEITATHPAFLGRWDGQDLVAHNFIAHLRRDANPAERIEVLPLLRMWEERNVADPFQDNAQRVVLNTNNCVNPAQCTTDFWQQGDSVIVGQPNPGAVDPEENVIDYSMLDGAQLDTVRLIGRRIAAQGGVYEAYVDLAMDRYLGYDLGTMVPPARQALVEVLVDSGGDVRAVDRAILTSDLYTAASNYEEDVKPNPEDWDPPYWHGPVKQMDAETWLSSAQRLVGLEPGSCDHRYPNVQQGSSGFHAHDYPTTDGSTPDYQFRDQARLLGGCPDQVSSFREARAGLVAALTQATLTKDLCESAMPGSPIYPQQFVEDPADKSETALSAAGNQIYAAAMIKPVPEGASDALSAGVDGCRSTTACDPEQFAFHTCRLILKSADFLFY